PICEAIELKMKMVPARPSRPYASSPTIADEIVLLYRLSEVKSRREPIQMSVDRVDRLSCSGQRVMPDDDQPTPSGVVAALEILRTSGWGGLVVIRHDS